MYGKAVKSSDVGQYMRFRKGISSRLSKALARLVLTDKMLKGLLSYFLHHRTHQRVPGKP